nr:MAG: rep protein [Cressdnaviricota sp.]
MAFLDSDEYPASYKGTSFLITVNQTERWPEVKDVLYKYDPTYIIACNEKAPTTGHEHIHCLVQYEKQTKLPKGQLLGINVRSVTYTPWKVQDYIRKDGDVFLEQGDLRCRGRKATKTHLPTIEEAGLLTNKEYEQYSSAHAKTLDYARRSYALLHAKEHMRFEPVKVHWLYGPTGTGKSRRAFEAGAYRLTYRDGFFNDWGDAKILWLDDYRGEIPYNLLLQLLDGYRSSLIVNIKGGHKVVDYDEMYITSPLSPSDCYPRQAEKQDSIKQLLRRITDTVWTGGAHVLDPRADLNHIEKICDENQFY